LDNKEYPKLSFARFNMHDIYTRYKRGPVHLNPSCLRSMIEQQDERLFTSSSRFELTISNNRRPRSQRSLKAEKQALFLGTLEVREKVLVGFSSLIPKLGSIRGKSPDRRCPQKIRHSRLALCVLAALFSFFPFFFFFFYFDLAKRRLGAMYQRKEREIFRTQNGIAISYAAYDNINII